MQFCVTNYRNASNQVRHFSCRLSSPERKRIKVDLSLLRSGGGYVKYKKKIFTKKCLFTKFFYLPLLGYKVEVVALGLFRQTLKRQV